MSEQAIIETEEKDATSPNMENAQEDESVLDLLNRDEAIKTLMRIAESLSIHKKNACYALDGKWGIGKTFVLDRLEEQLKTVSTAPDSVDSRFLIFRYNCWEYDYYEEPLLAIIAVLLDQLENYTSQFAEEVKGRIVQTLKKVGKAFVKIGVNYVSSHIGVDSDALVDAVGEGLTEKINDKSFDQYINFKKNLNDLREELKILSTDYTVIFIVDELDRCLPEYGIRVLERLHHLMKGLPNTQMLLAVDSEQLVHTVRQIFGEDADVTKYLAKFIQFKVLLSEGDPIELEKFNIRFKEYRDLFGTETHLFITGDIISTFIRSIFKGIEVRQKIALVEKCQLIHSFCDAEKNTSDPIYMCLELMLSIIRYNGLKSYCNYYNRFKDVQLLDSRDQRNEPLTGIIEVSKLKETEGYEYGYSSSEKYINVDSFWGWLTLLDYSLFFEKPSNVYVVNRRRDYAFFEEYAKRFWTYLHIVE